MQKCSKFQFQSKILYKSIFCGIFTILLIFSINSQVYGESNERVDISKYVDMDGRPFASDFAEVRQTDKIIFEVGKDTTVHVKHVIIGSGWGDLEPKLIKMLPGKHSNLEVADEDGDPLRPIGFVGETFEESEYIIAGQKAYKAYDLVAEYDLENFLELSDDGLWSKHLVFPHDVEIFFDDEIEIIFANNRPVDIKSAKGINCMGCDIRIEFFDESEPIIKKVFRSENKFEEISNAGKEFTLEFFSDGTIDNLDYIKELNYLSFNGNKENQLISMKIPLDLLLSPYHVFLSEYDQEILVESDQIRKSEYGQTETHANLTFRPGTEGMIHVVGSDEMEHEKLLSKLQKLTDQAVASEANDPYSLTDAIKNQDTIENDDELKNDSEKLYENWGDINSNKDENIDNTIIFVIVGIVAVIIVGIVIKLKKN